MKNRPEICPAEIHKLENAALRNRVDAIVYPELLTSYG